MTTEQARCCNVRGAVISGGTPWTDSTEKRIFWQRILAAVGAEYKEVNSITGVSGISHVVTAIGMDDIGKRIIVVSGEHDAKAAALSQVDIQLTMPEIRVWSYKTGIDFSSQNRFPQ